MSVFLSLLLLTASQHKAAEPDNKTSDRLFQEQHIAEQITQGQPVWLSDGSREFLTHDCPAIGNNQGGLLWVAAPNQTVLSPGIMANMCQYFSSRGWHSLAVSPGDLDFSRPQIIATQSSTNVADTANSSTKEAQATVLANQKLWYEQQAKNNADQFLKRLRPAEQQLAATQSNYVLVVVSESATLALEAVNKAQLQPAAMVLLDVRHPKDPQQVGIIEQLQQLTMPILDIYHVNAKQAAAQRRRMITQTSYSQRLIPGVDNDFRGVEQQVLHRIETWLKKLPD